MEDEKAKLVRMFVKLANLTQTSQLHKWNIQSLDRALNWAYAAETVVGEGELQQDINKRIREWFPVATLPTLPITETLTANALRRARFHILRSVLQSPFLSSHPTRSELIVAVLNELRKRREDSTYPSLKSIEEQMPNSALLIDTVVGAHRRNAMLGIASRLSESSKRLRVQVLSGCVTVPPLKSYALSPRTLQLKAMAKTLQRNAVDARAAVKPETYQTFLKDLRELFEAHDSKVVRVRSSSKLAHSVAQVFNERGACQP
ncbi:hypothetical protein PsorP6_013676 [Peronosclerospora sorghi]|uniref:Uncharacterized protein n=1 Tax=Peronosclerospora sorghi TaxID=230839 RepID=A0ACC0VHZ8_9STRA|nr:hypothetical protein PsorP6_013676 [Peronosclerospora sorghi]